MKQILVLGYFGYRNNQLDGQTVKTRNVLQMLRSRYNAGNVDFFDTQTFRKNPMNIFVMIFKIIQCNTLIYLPAHNNLRVFFPAIYSLSKLFHFKIIYLVVGGWLIEFLETRPKLAKKLAQIECICTETQTMKDGLKIQYGIENVVVYPNFRINDFTLPHSVKHTGFKLVFMSRIHKLKGLDIVFLIAEKMPNILIDFYGQINIEDTDYFNENIKKYNNTKYMGALQPEQIYKTLMQYDAMILPTRYYTEGFPGAILDAYISAIPVIVSDWKHAHEFIDDGKTGYICSLDDPKQFIDKIMLLYSDRDLLNQLKINAYNKSKEYSVEKAWSKLNKHL